MSSDSGAEITAEMITMVMEKAKKQKKAKKPTSNLSQPKVSDEVFLPVGTKVQLTTAMGKDILSLPFRVMGYGWAPKLGQHVALLHMDGMNGAPYIKGIGCSGPLYVPFNVIAWPAARLKKAQDQTNYGEDCDPDDGDDDIF